MKGTTTIAVVILLILCTACSKNVPQQLPADWPIHEMTLPADVRIDGVTQILGASSSPDRGWNARFEGDSNMDSIASHIEMCIRPLGFKELVAVKGSLSTEAVDEQIYLSSDLKTEVTLMRFTRPVGEGRDRSDYWLSVFVTEKPSSWTMPIESGEAELRVF